MSTILEYIINIFTFQLSPIVSIAFYLALLIIPGLTFMAVRSKTEGSFKMLSLSMKVLAGIIFGAGIIIMVLIAKAGTELDLKEDVNGQKVTAVLTNPQQGWVYLEDGEYFVNQGLAGEDAKNYLATNENAKEIDGNVYDKMEEDARPKAGDLSRVMLADETVLMVQNGVYYNEGLIETSIGFSLLIVIICFGMMLGYGIFKMVDDPKGAMKPLIIFGALVVVIALGYAIEGSVFEPLSDKVKANLGSEVHDYDQKDAGGGIITSFILIGVASVLAIAWSLVNMIRLNR